LYLPYLLDLLYKIEDESSQKIRFGGFYYGEAYKKCPNHP
jgi:hypothetical protein